MATERLFLPRWNQQILEETANSLLKKEVANNERIKTLFQNVVVAFPDALVENYEHLIGKLGCSDPDDEHVLASAVVSNAGAVLTYNSKDFPEDSFDRHGVEILHPDEFLMSQVNLNRIAVIRSIAFQLESYSKPELDAFTLAEHFQNIKCKEFASFIISNKEEIDSQVEQLST
jgi:predicted nucleic acid-binding protein